MKVKEVRKENIVFESGDTMDYDLLLSVPPSAIFLLPEQNHRKGKCVSSHYPVSSQLPVPDEVHYKSFR